MTENIKFTPEEKAELVRFFQDNDFTKSMTINSE